MSILVRSNSSNSSSTGGGSGDGFPPGDVSIIEIGTSTGTISVKWSDPEDTIFDKAVFVTWAGTILVRNDDHFPTNINDGVLVIDNKERNKYKDTWFTDTGLINNVTYYYRFFTYSDQGVYNDSGDLIFKKICGSIGEPVFADNTWEQIGECVEKDNIPTTWKIGDKKLVTYTTPSDYEIYYQIWDFDHFEKADGSGKAKLVIGVTSSYRESVMNQSASEKSYGYENTYMNKTTIPLFYDNMPDEIKPLMKEVIIEHSKITHNSLYGNMYETLEMTAKLFIPGTVELGYNKGYGGFGTKFPYFTTNSSRLMYSVSGYPCEYWTRTGSSETGFYYIPGVSTSSLYPDGQSSEHYVITCFCI